MRPGKQPCRPVRAECRGKRLPRAGVRRCPPRPKPCRLHDMENGALDATGGDVRLCSDILHRIEKETSS